MNYPELMEVLETLLNYHGDHDDGVTADALWVAIEVLQISEGKDGRVSRLLQQLATQRNLEDRIEEQIWEAQNESV